VNVNVLRCCMYLRLKIDGGPLFASVSFSISLNAHKTDFFVLWQWTDKLWLPSFKAIQHSVGRSHLILTFKRQPMTRRIHRNPRLILYRLSRFSKHRSSRRDGLTPRGRVLRDSVIVCCSAENAGPEAGYYTETPDSDDSMVGRTAFSRLDPVRNS
jgi:hypothetical protein